MNYQQVDSATERLAVGLGWFSIALGLAELAAPRSMARIIGAQPDERTTTVLRAYGAREIAAGVAILAQPDRARWLWSRVAGDAVDLASLAQVMRRDDAERGRTMFAIGNVLAVTALDVLCAVQLSARDEDERAMRRSARRDASAVHVERSVTVNRPVEEVYAFWSDFENFSRFMRHIEAVRVDSDGRSYWRAKAPAGMSVEWTAELVEASENERISWCSVEGSDVEHSGSVTFTPAPGARGTEIAVELTYQPPAGRLGRAVAWLYGEEPDQQVRDDLRRFKQIIETGEVTVSDGPSMWRAAQPAKNPAEVRALTGATR